MTINVTTDTSFLISGLVPPRRRIKDPLFFQQHDLYKRSNEILEKIASTGILKLTTSMMRSCI